jgi:hypothetical protein
MLGLGLGLQKSTKLGGFIGLLDLFPGAAAAYSLRKLRAAYSGSAVRVRKEVSAVSSETDIGFLSDGSLDTATLLTFASDADGGDVFVVTWYDQSLSNDATQSTGANQPKIVSSGAVITEGTSVKPAVDFDGVDDFLYGIFSLDVTLGYTNFYVCNVTNDDRKYILASVKNSSNRYAIGVNSLGDYQSTKRSGSIVADAATYSSGQVLLSDNSTPEIYLDGSLGVASSATLNNALVSEILTVGKDSSLSGSGQILGNMQEIILYNTDQSSNRTAIETNINTFYSIYS